MPWSGSFEENTVVDLETVPDACWRFSSCSGSLGGSVNPTSITINTDKSVTANFTVIQYTLSLTKSGEGWVRVNGVLRALPWSGQFSCATTVSLEAVPDVWYTFDHWSGSLSGTANPTSIGMTGSKSVHVWFISIDVDGDGLPDAWEQEIVSHNPGDDINDIWDVLPWDDYDGGGSPNEEEYCANTDPTDETSVFRIISVVRNSDASVSVFWSCVAGGSYVIEFCDEELNPAMMWVPAGGPIIAPLTGVYEWIDDGWETGFPPAFVLYRWYRVMVQGPCSE